MNSAILVADVVEGEAGGQLSNVGALDCSGDAVRLVMKNNVGPLEISYCPDRETVSQINFNQLD
jgi:hypothetical protein